MIHKSVREVCAHKPFSGSALTCELSDGSSERLSTLSARSVDACAFRAHGEIRTVLPLCPRALGGLGRRHLGQGGFLGVEVKGPCWSWSLCRAQPVSGVAAPASFFAVCFVACLLL